MKDIDILLSALTFSMPGGFPITISMNSGWFAYNGRKSHCFVLADLCNTITCQPIDLESCSHPQDSSGLLGQNEKKLFLFFG